MLSAGSKALLGHLDSSAMDIVTQTARPRLHGPYLKPTSRASMARSNSRHRGYARARYAGGEARSANKTMGARTAVGTPRVPRALPSPPKKSMMGGHGKKAAQWVRKHPVKAGLGVGAGIAVASFVNNSGRSMDKTSGRPTGMYRF